MPGDDSNLLSQHVGHALSGEDGGHVPLQGGPVLLDGVVHVHLLAPKIADNVCRLRAERDVEGIRQAVGGAGAEDHGAVTKLGSAQGGSRRHAGLAHTAFAGV